MFRLRMFAEKNNAQVHTEVNKNESLKWLGKCGTEALFEECLVLETCTRLIMEDLGLDFNEANRVRLGTCAFGRILDLEIAPLPKSCLTTF